MDAKNEWTCRVKNKKNFFICLGGKKSGKNGNWILFIRVLYIALSFPGTFFCPPTGVVGAFFSPPSFSLWCFFSLAEASQLLCGYYCVMMTSLEEIFPLFQGQLAQPESRKFISENEFGPRLQTDSDSVFFILLVKNVNKVFFSRVAYFFSHRKQKNALKK